MVSWKGWPAGTGCWPTVPAATWTFWFWMALMTSQGRQAARGQLIRVEPEAHAVIALTEHDDVADPVEAQQLVLELDGGEIAHVDAVVAAVRREQVDHQQDAGRAFLGVDALELHLRRQLGLGQGDAVLNEHLGHVHVGADLERDCQRVIAVVCGLRRHVQHTFDAIDLLLDRGRHGVGHHLRVGAWVARRHLHRGGRDVGIRRWGGRSRRRLRPEE